MYGGPAYRARYTTQLPVTASAPQTERRETAIVPLCQPVTSVGVVVIARARQPNVIGMLLLADGENG
jgi:hypothetical protein